MAAEECQRVFKVFQTTQAAEGAVKVGGVLGVFLQDPRDLLSQLIQCHQFVRCLFELLFGGCVLIF